MLDKNHELHSTYRMNPVCSHSFAATVASPHLEDAARVPRPSLAAARPEFSCLHPGYCKVMD